MRTGWKVLVISCAICLSLYSAIPTAAQDNGNAGCTLKVGVYRDLNFWRQLKIGTAEFVNPGLFKTTALAYRYDGDSLKNRVPIEDLVSDLNTGKVAIAKTDQDKYSVYRPGSPQFASAVSDLRAKWNTASMADVVLVAAANSLHDVPATQQIVSWDATEPAASAACVP